MNLTCECGRCQTCKNREKMRRWRAANPERARAGGMWERAQPDYRRKHAAHTYIHNRLKRGLMTRGACEVCGDPDTQAHHDDYDKPGEVRWLCRTHHVQHHLTS